jgi:hypothetical protein
MMHILLPIFIFAVWLLLVFVCALASAARGYSGGTSIFPGIPVVPLAAWGLSAFLNWLHSDLGLFVVGGFHVLLLLALFVSAIRSLHAIKRKKSG